MDETDITIIGAGVVGLAVAARISGAGKSILILEKNPSFGMETSSRNSEVIHSGIYYPTGTLKARLCVAGNDMLYRYCVERAIRCANTGKIVVAADEEEKKYLAGLMATGTRNGAKGLEILSREKIKELEPRIDGTAGLLVPSTGIIDSHGLMQSLLAEAQDRGALMSYNSEVRGLDKTPSGFHVHVNNDYMFKSSFVINCAGLNSDKVAAMAGIDIDRAGYRLHYCKGSYFKTSRPLGVKRLIYPVPPKNIQSLGIHLVLDLNRGVRFGPDAVYTNKVDYSVDETRKEAFVRAIQKYLPEMTPYALSPDMSGVRPKLQAEGESFRDFVITDEKKRGLDGLINLIGIDSPGLTSSLAIADYVGDLLKISKTPK